MKSLYRLYFFLVLSLSVTVSQAQPSLGLSNLAGFPDVITQGTQYNVSGWIVNRGNVAFSGSIDMKMLVNGTDLLSVTNNFIIQTQLLPGDSVLWMESNYTFPPGQFRLGNNDIIVWPTAPNIGNLDQDTIGKPVYFTDNAALRLTNSGFGVFGEYASLDDEYTFICAVVNDGSKHAPDGVDLFVQMNWFDAVFVQHFENDIEPGETVEFEIQDFNILEAFRIGYGDLMRNDPLVLKFFAIEHDLSMDPLNYQVVPVAKVLAVDHFGRTGVKVFPNPATDEIYVDESLDADLVWISLRDMTGKLVKESHTKHYLSLLDLPKGSYLFEASFTGGETIHKLIVKE